MPLYVQDGQSGYEADLDNIVLAIKQNGVLTGMAVSAQGTPNLSVQIASGTIQWATATIVVGASASIAVNAGGANPRIDLIWVDSGGNTGTTEGTPGATPKPPSLPANSILLAFVSVAAGAANIQNSNISARVLIVPAYVAPMAAHGASLHTDRTRDLWLSLDGAAVVLGTPAKVAQGTLSAYSAWGFDATARELIGVQFLVPADWVSGVLTPKLYWTNLGAGAGNVYWELQWEAHSETENLNVAGESDDIGTQAAPAQNILKISTGGTLTPTAGELVALRFGRDGSSGADTLANDVGLIGIKVEYTADS